MKTLRVFTLLLLPFMAMAQNAPFPPASTSDVVAGTERNKFVSPYTLSQAGFSSPTGGITAAVATNIAAYQAQLATNGLSGGGGVDAPTVVSIMSTNNSATANFAKASPVQMPSSLFSSWNSGTLLLTNGNSIQDSNSLSEATIGNIGSTMALYYTSYDGGYTGRIWAAYGSLLNGFTKHGIVLAPTAASWDASSIGGATHYREGNTNYLYYFGGNNAAGFEVDPLSIGVAYSTDGTNYTKYSGNPIMRSNNVAASCVTCYTWFTKKTATGYLGFFNAKHNTGAEERIHLASANNPLGPWTYVGEIYHHTNATITSDFTIADLPSGGYIAAYWIKTNGNFTSGSAYSSDLTNWVPAGSLNGATLVGTRLFYDDGIALSYCVSAPGFPGSVSYSRPTKSNLGNVIADNISLAYGGAFTGNGNGISNVSAASSLLIKSSFYSGLPVLGGSFDDVDTFSLSWSDAVMYPTNSTDLTYSLNADRWQSRGAWSLGDRFYVTNSPAGTNIAIVSSLGSVINGVGLTNGSLTAPNNLSVAGTFTVGTTTTTQLLSTATGNTNRMPVWGPTGNLTNVSLVNMTLNTGVFPATLTASSSPTFNSGAMLTIPEYPPVTSSALALAASNTVYCRRFMVPLSMWSTNLAWRFDTAVAGGFLGFSIYATDGNRVCDTGALDASSGAASYKLTAWSSPVLLTNGWYYFAWSGNSTTIALRSDAAASTSSQILNSTGDVYIGTAANASSGGQNPSTLGTVTAINGVSTPIVGIKNK